MPDIGALIQRWQEGDERAAAALYECYQTRLLRLAYGVLGDLRDAEEAAQDALTYALIHIDRYDPGRSSFSTWVHMIAISRCRDRLRRRRPLASLLQWLGVAESVPDPAPAPEEQAQQAEMRGEVWDAVQALSPLLREAILLRYWAGHTYREMSEILRCPIPTAQSRVRLAYGRLRKALAAKERVETIEEQAL
jgi:RNA polymerase sigma-70 factor (ECF subfamily)